MKKFIFLIGILFCVSANIFGYSWTAKNDSSETLNIELCTTPGIENCQDTTLPAGQSHTFNFNQWYNTGLLLGSITVKKDGDETTEQNFDGVKVAGQTRVGIASGGSFVIHADPSTGYSFSNN